jgi:hypothetical protein
MHAATASRPTLQRRPALQRADAHTGSLAAQHVSSSAAGSGSGAGGGSGSSAGGGDSDMDHIYRELLRRLREEQEQLGQAVNEPF